MTGNTEIPLPLTIPHKPFIGTDDPPPTTPPTSPSPSENATSPDEQPPSASPLPGGDSASPATAPTSPPGSSQAAISSCPQSPSQQHDERLLKIPPTQIDEPKEYNGRFERTEQAIAEMCQSLLAYGQLQPIIVQPAGARFTLIAGGTRLAAARRLNWPLITAMVDHRSEQDQRAVRLVENCVRTGLSPVEEAVQLHDLVENHPHGVDGVAATLSKSVDWIQNRLELLSYGEELLGHIHAKRISLAAAKHLARIPDPHIKADRIRNAALHGITAATASLWLQDAMSQPTDLEPAEIPPLPEPVQAYSTTVYARCVLCDQSPPIDQTNSVRICHPCHAGLFQAKQNVGKSALDGSAEQQQQHS